MAHVLICFGWKTPITSITAYIIRPDSITTNQRYVKQCALCVSLSEHVPKILGTQRDAGTRLATALRRRPFSACNKGNWRRLHAGNEAYCEIRIFSKVCLCMKILVWSFVILWGFLPLNQRRYPDRGLLAQNGDVGDSKVSCKRSRSSCQ